MTKGEIAVLSNFFFYYNVFRRRLLQRRQKASLYRKGLKPDVNITEVANAPIDLMTAYYRSSQIDLYFNQSKLWPTKLFGIDSRDNLYK